MTTGSAALDKRALKGGRSLHMLTVHCTIIQVTYLSGTGRTVSCKRMCGCDELLTHHSICMKGKT